MLEEMTWPEAERALREADVALVPVGTLEQHGYHLPCGTDTLVAVACAKELARRYGKAVVFPAIHYGNSETMMDWPGTATIQSDTLMKLCDDVCDSVARTGLKKIIFVNGHGGNFWELAVVAKRAQRRTGCIVAAINPWVLAAEEIGKLREQPPKGGVHACEVETSIALAAFELLGKLSLAHMDKATGAEARYPSRFVHIDIVGGDSANLSWDMNRDWSPTGAIGNPEKASLEKGRRILEAFFTNAIELMKEMDTLVAGRFICRK